VPLDLEKSVESIGKPLGLVAAAAYAVGVLITNLFLSGRGVFYGALLRTEYILAGLLWCFLISLPAVAFAYVRFEWRTLRTDAASRRYVRVAFGTLLTPLFFMYFPSTFLARLSEGAIGPGDISFYATVLSLCSCTYAAWATVRDLRVFREPLGSISGFTLYQFLLGPMLLLSGITLYARFTYPYLDSAFGGGRRAPVFVIVGPDAPRALLMSLPRSRRNPGEVGPVEILLEGEREFFLLPSPPRDEDRAVMVSRDLIKGVRPAQPAPPPPPKPAPVTPQPPNPEIPLNVPMEGGAKKATPVVEKPGERLPKS
jgi:hypothetical protein